MRIRGAIGHLILAAACMARADVPLHIHQGRPIVDGVYVNGHGPFRFLLDTGAESNQLDCRLADLIGLKPSYRVELATAAGSAYVPGMAAARMQLEGEMVTGELLFTPLDSVHMLSKEIQGVLGRAFLGRLDFLLDMRGRRLVFGKQEREGLRAAVDTSGSHPVIRTNLGRLVIDSGTDTLVLFRAGRGGTGAPNLRTAAGVTRGAAVGHWPLTIGRTEIRHLPAVIVPRTGGSEDGFLPAATFQWVYFCNSQGYVVLNV